MPQTKNCKKCNEEFVVADGDLELYKKVSPTFGDQLFEIPSATFCPDCRSQRRMTWRGEKKFYSRKCDLCGQPLITVFYPDSTYKVYCRDCWWSDKWSAQDTGRDFDFNRPFFDQFDELIKATPLLFSWNIYSENSEYNNNVSYLKDCYLLSSSNRDEDCYYGYYLNDSKDCIDCNSIKKSELMYESVECVGCYNCKYCKNSINCTDGWFLENCTGCKNCFACCDLKQKQYCYFNEQLTQEQYEQKLKEFNSGSLSQTKEMTKKAQQEHLKFPYKFMIGENNENVSGNIVHQSKNSHNCFDCIEVENCQYCHQMQEAKDCMDMMTWGRPGELLYECQAVGSNAYLNRFCNVSQDSRNNLYSYYPMFSNNNFGCVSIKHGEYLILNKQYSKEEYEQLVPKIIEHMKKNGEWGEFFPSKLSPFCYNEAVSNDWRPLSKEEALAQGEKWRDPDPKEYLPQSYQVADDIADVSEDIIKEILACKNCGQNYKIIPQELAFCKANTLPIPDFCPSCRHIARMKKRNPRHLWHRQCVCEESGHDHTDKCPNEFETTFAPDRPEKVYCETCYQKSVL